MNRLLSSTMLVPLFAVFGFIYSGFSATNYVSLSGNHVFPFASWPDAATNIQSAVSAANTGDTVLIAAGTYTLSSTVVVTNNITVEGSGNAEDIIVNGGNQYRCFYLNHTWPVLRNLTIIDGQSPGVTFPDNIGGGVFCDNGGTIENCIIRDSQATFFGGGVYILSNGVVRGCLVLKNASDNCGGVYCKNGGVVENCTILYNNTVRSPNGGGIWCDNGGTVRNSIIYNNYAMYGSSSALTANVHTIGSGWNVSYSCTYPAVPGDFNITNDPSFIHPVNNFHLSPDSACIDAGTNLAWMTGAVTIDGMKRILGGTVDMGPYEVMPRRYVAPDGGHQSPFSSWATAATNIQDAVDAAADDGSDSVLISNGIYHVSSPVIVNKNISISSVAGSGFTKIEGGGVTRCFILNNTSSTVSGLTFSGGRAENGAGVLLLSGTLDICVMQYNYSTNDGAGVYCLPGGIIRNSIISDNSAGRSGGGIYFDGGGTIENATLYHNTAGTSGGGVYCDSGGTLRNSIIYFNSALQGSNYYLNGSAMIFQSCCVSPDITGAADGGGNISADPLFINREAGNVRLDYDSPCVDAGTNMPWMVGATDLAGAPRINNSIVDMGAYELSAHFVSPDGQHSYPYSSWITAATNIQAAVDAAGDGSQVVVNDGIYSPTAEVVITYSIVLRSLNGPELTHISGSDSHRCVSMHNSNASMDGFTLRNGLANDHNSGGGLLLQGGVVRNCTITGNLSYKDGGGVMISEYSRLIECLVTDNVSSNNGGGIEISSDLAVEIRVSSCTVTGNSARQSGGGINAKGLCTISQSMIAGNTAGQNGGGINAEGVCTISQSVITGNSSGSAGGGARLYGDIQVADCTVVSNTTRVAGGGMMVAGNTSVRDTFIAHNIQNSDSGFGGGGALCVETSSFENCIITDNTSSNQGGGVMLGGGFIRNCTISENTALNSGGGIMINENGSVEDSLVSDNVAFNNGGGIEFKGSPTDVVSVSNCTVAGNTANQSGGGVSGGRPGTLYGCIIAGNSSGAAGGGLRLESDVTVSHCTIVSNSAMMAGGGAMIMGQTIIRNSLIANNVQTSTNFGGGAVLAVQGGSLENCTITANTSSNKGGGIYYFSTSSLVTSLVRNTIVYHNTAAAEGDNYYDTFNGLLFDHSCTFPAITNGMDFGGTITNDPSFADFDNGNYRISIFSYCRNAGTNLSWMSNATDRDGESRIMEEVVDMGAYETVPEPSGLLLALTMAIVSLFRRSDYTESS